MARSPTPINVVPHFMRLHEWIALFEGYYEQEGLDPHLLAEHMHDISSHGADDYFERPQDQPYLERQEVCSTACHWAVPMNAGAGMGKLVPDLHGLTRYAIFVAPGSGITRLGQLRDVPVGIGLMAGSHFSFLELMEKVLPKEHIKPKNIGGPGRRLEALLNGEVEAANLLDPEIPMAEQKGLAKIASGEFKTLFWVSPTISHEVLAAYFRVMRRANDALFTAPERYMHLWENNVPPHLKDDSYDYARFGLGEVLVFEEYTQQEYDRTLALAKRWGLDDELRADSHVIQNISISVTF